jgi:hypothetical protein
VQKINNRGPITAGQRRNCLANRLPEETPDDYSNGHVDENVDGEPADQQLFEDEIQPAGRLFTRKLCLSGPVLPQIPLMVAGQPNEPASRLVQRRKRSQVAIEAEDEHVIQPKRRRMKRTG